MPTTMQLLDRALSVKTQARWADSLELSDAALSQAKKRGRLSPTVAGSIAAELGDNPEHWIAIAALEAEPPSPARTTLMRKLGTVLKL